MTDEKDAQLLALFNEAQEELPGEAFTAQVMDRIQGMHRQRTAAFIGIDIVLVVIAWLLAEPLQEMVTSVMPSLMATLVQLENQALAELLLPVNNVASVVLLGLIAVRSA